MPRATTGPAADYPVVLGEPYKVGDTVFSPANAMNYDAVGYASVGGPTVGVSAAHHTLPMPSYVEVTSLTSGRTILVRVERRGPMDSTHAIELSPAAIAQLGLSSDGRAPVRVRRVNPLETERALLRSGMNAPERMVTPKPLLAVLSVVWQPTPMPIMLAPLWPAAFWSVRRATMMMTRRWRQSGAQGRRRPCRQTCTKGGRDCAHAGCANRAPGGHAPVNGASYAAPYAPPRFTAVAPVRTPTELAMAAPAPKPVAKIAVAKPLPKPKTAPIALKPASARQRRRFRADLSCNMAPLPKRLAHKLWPMPQGRKWWAEALSGAYGQPLMHRARPKPLWLKPRRLVIPKRESSAGIKVVSRVWWPGS
jgi:rare lipoprotein A